MFENWVGKLTGGRKERSAEPAVGSASEDDDAAKPRGGTRADFRRMLVDDIGDFLILHDLDLTALNFDLAREVVTGHDVRLTAAVQQLLASGERLTNIRAQEIVASASPGRLTPEVLSEMLATLEIQAESMFGVATRSGATFRTYGEALEHHMSSLGQEDRRGDASAVVTRLVTLTLGMVERAAAIEAEMRESQKQARKLKKSLDRARHAADHDELTGLPNRRAFERRYAEEIEQAREMQHPLAVAFCDIDNFKIINDSHGHATGDRVLTFVATLLQCLPGQQCHVARHGGEEFVMLFPGLTPQQAFEIVDHLREKLEVKRLIDRATGERMAPVTFSAGVADVLAYPSPREALEAADAALYQAKQSGRNRTMTAVAPGSSEGGISAPEGGAVQLRRSRPPA
jgi:diguanylate cyclase